VPRQGGYLLLASLMLTLNAGPAAARSAHGLTFTGDQAYVAAVEIAQHDAGAPPAFADGLRAAMLAEAALYGSTGQPIVLNVDLDKVHLKNPVASMLIGDNNITAGHVAVVDQASGQPLGDFKIRVDAERHRGASIALAVVGALDPTGYVDIATTVGGAGAALANRPAAEVAMSVNFAEESLRQTFGDDRSKAAHAKKP
jgi:hypothetical protein